MPYETHLTPSRAMKYISVDLLKCYCGQFADCRDENGALRADSLAYSDVIDTIEIYESNPLYSEYITERNETPTYFPFDELRSRLQPSDD